MFQLLEPKGKQLAQVSPAEAPAQSHPPRRLGLPFRSALRWTLLPSAGHSSSHRRDPSSLHTQPACCSYLFASTAPPSTERPRLTPSKQASGDRPRQDSSTKWRRWLCYDGSDAGWGCSSPFPSPILLSLKGLIASFSVPLIPNRLNSQNSSQGFEIGRKGLSLVNFSPWASKGQGKKGLWCWPQVSGPMDLGQRKHATLLPHILRHTS